MCRYVFRRPLFTWITILICRCKTHIGMFFPIIAARQFLFGYMQFLYKKFTVKIQHIICQFLIYTLSEKRVTLHKFIKIIFPAVVPFKIKPQCIFMAAGHPAPRTGILRNQNRRTFFFYQHFF